MFSVKAKPMPTMPAYTMPSRTPSSSARRHHSSRKRKSPLQASSVTGATTSSVCWSVKPPHEAADALEQERGGGRDEAAPQQAGGEQRARLGLVAVQPQVAGDERADRHARPAAVASAMLAGAPDERQRSRGSTSAPTPTRTVTTTVNATDDAALDTAGPGHGRQPIGARPERPAAAAYSGAVSEQRAPSTEPKTESHDPAVPAAYAAFMREGWGDRELDLPVAAGRRPGGAAPRSGSPRRSRASGWCCPAGTFKVRAYDTDYRFRPDTAHTYFSGNQTSDAVLVIADGESVLYARPRSSRDTDEFFRDRQYGELWAGRRPSLKEMSDSLGLEVRHIDDLDAVLQGDRQDPRPAGLSTTSTG